MRTAIAVVAVVLLSPLFSLGFIIGLCGAALSAGINAATAWMEENERRYNER